jgi:hypothetical protein
MGLEAAGWSHCLGLEDHVLARLHTFGRALAAAGGEYLLYRPIRASVDIDSGIIYSITHAH